ncbi:hypothetical protein IH779_03195 [Patescibacteria group bacterium]|nr:hypothetical protein [Patescibacteria group bacterium]
MAPVQLGNIVYDYRRIEILRNGDFGEEVILSESQRGEFPSCFPEEYSKEAYNSEIAEASHFEVCSCERHTIHWLEVPQEIWPEATELRIRVLLEGD